LAENKGLELNCNLSPSLVIAGDMDLLIRSIVNLVDNAIKYTYTCTLRFVCMIEFNGDFTTLFILL
jgi:signal transduction histidine kinase